MSAVFLSKIGRKSLFFIRPVADEYYGDDYEK